MRERVLLSLSVLPSDPEQPKHLRNSCTPYRPPPPHRFASFLDPNFLLKLTAGSDPTQGGPSLVDSEAVLYSLMEKVKKNSERR